MRTRLPLLAVLLVGAFVIVGCGRNSDPQGGKEPAEPGSLSAQAPPQAASTPPQVKPTAVRPDPPSVTGKTPGTSGPSASETSPDEKPLVILKDEWTAKPGGFIDAGALAPDGKMFALAELRFGPNPSKENYYALSLYDVPKANELVSLPLEGMVQSMAFSSDGTLLATGTADFTRKTDGDQNSGVIGIWDLRTRQRVTSIGDHDHAIVSVKFSPDPKVLASADLYGALKLYDTTTRRLLRVLSDDKERIYRWDMAFSPDGKILATGGGKFHGVRLWNTTTGKVDAEFAEQLVVDAVAISDDGTTLAYTRHSIGNGKGIFVRVVDMKSRNAKRIDGPWFRCLSFSHDGRFLAGGREDPFKDVILLELATGKEWSWPKESTLGVIRNGIHRINFSPDGKFVLAVSKDQVSMWNMQAAKPVKREP